MKTSPEGRPLENTVNTEKIRRPRAEIAENAVKKNRINKKKIETQSAQRNKTK